MLLLAALLAACGGAAKQVRYTPMTPEQERVFDQGVDFVAALEGLEGRWRDDWSRDLEERVSGADYIGIVQIDTLLTETDPEQRVTHRLVAKVKRSLLREQKDLELRVTEGQAGFPTVHDNLQRIQSREFVVYAKWYLDSDGEKSARFHLSPSSDVIVGETERVITLRNNGETPSAQERVVVHTN